MGSCTSGQSGVGHTEWGGARHRWAEEEGLESILQVTGIMNTYSSFKEETVWLGEQRLGGLALLASLELLKLCVLPRFLVITAYGVSSLSGFLSESDTSLVPLPPAESSRTGYVHKRTP